MEEEGEVYSGAAMLREAVRDVQALSRAKRIRMVPFVIKAATIIDNSREKNGRLARFKAK